MELVAHDPYVNIPEDHGVETCDLEAVLARSDVLAVCVHLTSETRSMMNREMFSKMKPGAIFINTTRGEIVIEEDLVAAL